MHFLVSDHYILAWQHHIYRYVQYATLQPMVDGCFIPGQRHWDSSFLASSNVRLFIFRHPVDVRWQIFRIGTVRYAEDLWHMRRHGPVIAHCTNSEDFPARYAKIQHPCVTFWGQGRPLTETLFVSSKNSSGAQQEAEQQQIKTVQWCNTGHICRIGWQIHNGT